MSDSKAKSRTRTKTKKSITDESAERLRRIAQAAYYKAEQRGFAPGQEERDWLEAELEIDGRPCRS